MLFLYTSRPRKGRTLAAVLLLALLLASPVAHADLAVTVPGGPVTVYATPHLGAPVVMRLTAGARVYVVTYDANWATLRIGDMLGYAVSSYLGLGMTDDIVTDPPHSYVTPTPAPRHEMLETDGANATVRTADHGPLHLRTGPSLNAPLINTYANGSRVRVLERDGDWYKVQAGTRQGYMSSQYVVLDAGAEPPEGSRYAAVVDNPGAGEILHLRALPSTDAELLGSYRDGTEMTVLEVGEKWHEVTVEGRSGYMMAEYVRLLSDRATPDRKTAGPVPLYQQPDAGSTLLLTIPTGAIITVIVPGPGFSHIRYSQDGASYEGFAASASLYAIDPIITEINSGNG